MKSILENIKEAVEKINWKNQTHKEKALYLCISIYNLYVYDGGDFNHYRSLSKEYFIKIIKTKGYVYEIKNTLIDNGILEPHFSGSYSVEKGKGKGYRFNQDLISGNYSLISGPKSGPKSIIENLPSLNKSFYNLNNLELYHICGPKSEDLVNERIKKIKIDTKVNDFIDSFRLKREDIKVNEEIDLDYVELKLENDTWYVSIEKAKEMAESDLILYKEKCYMENLDNFIERKSKELRLIFRKSIFEIENGIFRVSRNETNRRLDYNLTNMKSDLLDYLLVDGEKLVELDIANAQFAILNFLVDLDEDFKRKVESGNLYNGDKKEWFRVAFDKVKKGQDNFRKLYPKTMKFIDEYKKEFGYKSFSILLQNVESMIMIDGLMPRLEKFNVFPIHDAIRVKESELEAVKLEMEKYFNEIGFKCLLREKKKTEIINFKGYKKVEIEKVSKEDKRLFIQKINEFRERNIEPYENYFLYECDWSMEKGWYLYSKWRKMNPIKGEPIE
jgi:hypothetical protein